MTKKMPQNTIFETLGCRLNSYETEAMRKLAAANGVEDCVIVNTCAVTQEAVRNSRNKIRKLARKNPKARVIATGCAVQIDPKSFADMPEVTHVLGNADKLKHENWMEFGAGTAPRLLVNDIMSVREAASHLIEGFGGRARAYVQVQNGCDHRCTFCIIPFGRGNARSVPAGSIVDQITRLVADGYHEIVLTGVDITSWGKDLPGSPPFGDLVQRVLRLVPDLPRLRISSVDPVEIDQALIDAIRSEARLMPHLHLSLQAGDNLILKRMKRRHLREDAIRLCAELRKLRPEIVFGADIIAGFPTENDEMFEASARLIDDCGLTWLHVFPFSPRSGTPAAKMPQIDPNIAKKRAARLRAMGQAAVARHLDAQLGKKQAILVENEGFGRTESFAEVAFAQPQPIGSIVHATPRAIEETRLLVS